MSNIMDVPVEINGLLVDSNEADKALWGFYSELHL